MTGELIQLESHRDLRRGRLYRQQSVPRGAARATGGMSVIDLRMARINRLLAELEELTGPLQSVPPPMIERARASVEKARRIVRPATGGKADLGGTPQPVLDDERIERMYREFGRDP